MILGKILISIVFVGIIGTSFSLIFRKLKQKKKEKLRKKEAKALLSIAKYDCNTHTLNISEKSEKFFVAFKIKACLNAGISYEPEKYIPSDDSAGGINSGRADKKVGYCVPDVKKSIRCDLYFGDNVVNRIRLSNKLLKDTNKSVVSKYMEKDEILVFDQRCVKHSEMAQALIQQGDKNLYLLEAKAGCPTYAKCNEIINWLCGYSN